MTLKRRTALIIFLYAIIPVVFSIVIFILSTHFNLRNENIEQRFLISRWLDTELYPAVFSNRITELKIPSEIELCIINSSGIIVYSNTPLLQQGTYFSLIIPKFLDLIKGEQSRSISENFFYNSSRWQLFMMYSSVPKEFEKVRFLFLSRVLHFSLFIAAAGAILGSLFVGSVLKSVKKLEYATRRIADGDLDFELEPKGPDEFKALTASFDKMKQTLKEAHSRKSRFLIGISHDLKTPLTSIKGYLEAIDDGLAADNETRAKYLKIITDKTEVLEERISGLIDFARMETGEWKLKKKKVNLKPFIDDLSAAYREDCIIMGKKFVYENSFPENLAAECDPALIERALENHFTNALRYTFDGGTVFLKCFIKEGVPVIEIADNGEGIDEKELAFIFDPFYRGTNSRREQGMGLGLSTSKSIFENHGWTVSVSSRKGEGTVFRIVLVRISAEVI